MIKGYTNGGVSGNVIPQKNGVTKSCFLILLTEDRTREGPWLPWWCIFPKDVY